MAQRYWSEVSRSNTDAPTTYVLHGQPPLTGHPVQPQIFGQTSQQTAPATATVPGPPQPRRADPQHIYVRNLHFYLKCLDPNPDPRGHYDMFNITLERPISCAYIASLIHDDDIPFRMACYNHYISRTHLSPGRELFVKTNNFLYHCPDDLVVTVYSMPPFGNGDTLVPLSATRNILDKYCADIQHFEHPYLSYWLLYKGHRPVVNDDFQRVVLSSGQDQHAQNPTAVYDKLYSYCSEILNFPDSHVSNPERLNQIIGQL